MPRPSPLLLLPVVLLGLAACSGTSTTSGLVSDLDGRLCVQTAADDGTCFTTAPEQLAGLQLGTCVTVSYESSSGVLGRASDVRPAPDACG